MFIIFVEHEGQRVDICDVDAIRDERIAPDHRVRRDGRFRLVRLCRYQRIRDSEGRHRTGRLVVRRWQNCIKVFPYNTQYSQLYRSVDGTDSGRKQRRRRRLIDRGIEFHGGDAPSTETSAHHSRQLPRHSLQRLRLSASGSYLAQGRLYLNYK